MESTCVCVCVCFCVCVLMVAMCWNTYWVLPRKVNKRTGYESPFIADCGGALVVLHS